MRITPDTNVLVRAIYKDDPKQSEQAEAILRGAQLIALTLPALCEFVWVLRRSRRMPDARITEAIRTLVDSPQVETNRPAVAAGLAMLEAGGDFADGVIAFEGRRLGGEVFATFDRNAASLLQQAGGTAELLGQD